MTIEQTFVNVHLPWIVTLAVTLMVGGWKLSRSFGSLEASLISKMGVDKCAELRESCAATLREELKDEGTEAKDLARAEAAEARNEIEKARKERTEQLQQIRDSLGENREAFARAEGSLSKAVAILEDAVKEMRRANGKNIGK